MQMIGKTTMSRRHECIPGVRHLFSTQITNCSYYKLLSSEKNMPLNVKWLKYTDHTLG